MNYLKSILLLMSVIIVSCQSMNDTYSDIINKKNDRYIGKCSEVVAERGWNRIKITWTNSIDPIITKIKVRWSTRETADSVYLEKGTTEFITPSNLSNENYKITVCSVDDKNRESIPIYTYCEPFSEQNELVSSLKVIEKKCFFIGNKLVLLMHEQNENIKSASIDYYSTKKEHIDLTNDDFKKQIKTIDNVDKTKPIFVKVSMSINDCIDDATFEPYELKVSALSLSSDFIKILKDNYTIEGDIDKKFLESVRVLDINTNVNSLEDLLFFPNIEKIIVGSKKYLAKKYESIAKYLFELKQKNLSIDILKLLQTEKDLKIEIYGNNFDIKDEPELKVTSFDPAVVPDLQLITMDQMTTWYIAANSPIEESCQFANILDNNPNTVWKPEKTRGFVRTHQIVIDMQEIKDLNGFLYSQARSSIYSKYLPNSIKIALSTNKQDWYFPLNNHDIEVGSCPEEKTVIDFGKINKARYILIQVTDNVTRFYNYVVIGDLIPY